MRRELCHGDNLDFLRAMPSESVDLVATDPPFNTGRDFGRFDDRWGDGELIDHPLIHCALDFSGSDTAHFLSFLYPRLIEMHRVLRKTGSFYLHIDRTAHAWVRCLADAVFGRNRCLSDIVWKRTAAKGGGKRYATVTDSILYYAKSSFYTWNPYYIPLSDETEERWYVNDDGDGRGPYNRGAYLISPSPPRDENVWRGIYLGDNRSWRAPLTGQLATIIERDYIPDYCSIKDKYERLEALDAVRLIHWPQKDGGLPSLKKYKSMVTGTAPHNLFDDLPMMRDLPKERTGYPTQKPLALYERIVGVSSNKDDVILDPFAGSGTTLVAAERLGRQWTGMDLWPDDSLRVVLNRLTSESVSIADVEYNRA